MTMQLPTTYVQAVEAEALAYAKNRIAWFRERRWFSPDSLLSPEAARAFARQHLKQRALEHPNHMLQIIGKARAGYKDFREAMLELANEYHHRREHAPPPLAAFQMDWNAGLLRRTRTRDKVSNSTRNAVIAYMVWLLCGKFGLKPTRRSRRRSSACSIMAVALASEFPPGIIKPDEKEVETIWNEWKLLAVPSPSLYAVF
jgi:hypothetical protein